MTTRLPVVGTTAATTAFCSERLDGPGVSPLGLSLYFDGNGKITAGNGTLDAPKPNAFSLLQISDCPQATPTCKASCYVHNLEKHQPDVHALYRHNSETIRLILSDENLAADWAMRVAHWVTQNASAGFRWHVSGDVFSLEYARWIADICRESPTVRHWIYTRSFDFLGPLVEVSTTRGGNLAINLSCDADNYEAAQLASATIVADGEPMLRLAYLTVDGRVPTSLQADDIVFPDYALRPRQFKTFAESPWWQTLTQFQRGLVCPADAVGKSEKIRCGPCSRCLR